MPKVSTDTRTLWPTRLREWRTRRGLSQRQLATLAGVSRLTVQRTELGRTRPHPLTLGCLAAALQVDAAELIGKQADDR